jgi:amidase
MVPNHFRTLTEMSAELSQGLLSSEELTKELLTRINDTEKTYRAYQCVMSDLAISQARQMDVERADGRVRGPLHGIPIALKDLIAVHGAPTLAGSPALTGWNNGGASDEEATVAIRLRDAGAVLLGKLKTTEGAHASHHPDVAPPLNPWNADIWSGVSSSGSGVATAAGLCFASLGTDTGGSIRFPCFANGAVGFKPTWGRVSRAGVFALAPSLDHIGPITRSVEDAAQILQVIAGKDPRDPTSVDVPIPDYVSEMKKGVSGLRIGIDEKYCEAAGPHANTAISTALKIWRTNGAKITPIRMPMQSGVAEIWNTLCAVETAIAHQRFYPERHSQYGPQFRNVLEARHSISAIDYANAHLYRLNYAGALQHTFTNIDLIISPSYVGLPPLATESDAIAAKDLEAVVRYTIPTDFSGSPTLSLPAGITKERVPFGFQLIGRHFEEENLLRAGYQYQENTTWKNQHP